MRKVILGIVPDDYHPDLHIPLGPWCFLGKEKEFHDWENTPFISDPFNGPEELARDAEKTCAYANELIPKLASTLNSVNRTEMSDSFWRLLVMPWLLSLVQAIWERQRRIERLLEQYHDQEIAVDLLKDNIDWCFRDTNDFVERGLLNPFYNEWIYSRILEQHIPAKWCVSWVDGKESALTQSVSGPCFSWKTILKSTLQKLAPRCRGVYGIGPFASVFWSAILTVKAVRPEASTQRHLTSENKEHYADLEWLIPDLDRLIHRSLPECFAKLRLPQRNKWGGKGKYRLLGPVLWFDEVEKIKVACAHEVGEKLVLTQHGGNYGNAKTYPLVAETEYRQDFFLTWGWSQQENYSGNFVPLPSPYLSKLIRKRRQKTNDLIVVGTRANVLSYRLDSTPQALEQLEYRRNKLSFLNMLRQDVFESCRYRPYFIETGSLTDLNYFSSNFPELRICRGDLHESLLACRFVVLDHPGTTLNLALAANIPVIGFWKKDSFAMCRQAESFFQALEEVGILFENGEDAACRINAVWDNLEDWWRQPVIQAARQKWCLEYARIDNNWWWQWIKFLWNA